MNAAIPSTVVSGQPHFQTSDDLRQPAYAINPIDNHYVRVRQLIRSTAVGQGVPGRIIGAVKLHGPD